MNYLYRYNRRKEIVKNSIYIFFILLLAVVSTYYIYHKFQGGRNIDFSSESLVVTYHESSGDKVSLTKVIPVTTAEYGQSKARRPFNSRLDKLKLVQNGFTLLPTWQDALKRYLEEIKYGTNYRS